MNSHATSAILVRPRNHMMPLTNPSESNFLADGRYLPDVRKAAAERANPKPAPRVGWLWEHLQD